MLIKGLHWTIFVRRKSGRIDQNIKGYFKFDEIGVSETIPSACTSLPKCEGTWSIFKLERPVRTQSGKEKLPKDGNQQRKDSAKLTTVKYAGQIKYCLEIWKKICKDNILLETITGLKLPFYCEPQQFLLPHNKSFSLEESQAINSEIIKLLSSGAIVRIEKKDAKFISSVFAVPKRNGTFRLVINLKNLNKYVQCAHFKMEDYRSVLSLMTKDCYMSIIDLKDAYHMIPIFEEHHFYLCFEWNGVVYKYTCLPFGLNVAPRIFTKLIKPVLCHLRSQGFCSVGFLDDFLLFGKSEAECRINYEATQQLYTQLGCLINTEKSNPIPVQEVKFLGFIFNSVSMTMALPDEKKNNIFHMCSEIITLNSQKKLTCLKVAQVIGTLIAACPAVPYGPLYTRQLEFEKTKALVDNNYHSPFHLSAKAISDLTWWKENIFNSIMAIGSNEFDLVITTDASLSGWGAHCDSGFSRGFWNTAEQRQHINCLELLAIFYGLKLFGCAGNQKILIRSDSTTAISYVNRYGGCRSTRAHDIAKQIWQFCEHRQIFIFASYISTSLNYEADMYSRQEVDQSDYKLGENYFSKICEKFGIPSVDLFATHHSAQCEKFASWFPDPQAYVVDAFTIKWDMFFYAFPPFGLVMKVLKKIVNEGGRGIVVVPKWESQPWYPLFLSCIQKPYITFKPNRNLLISPYNSRPHPLYRNLTLIVGVVTAQTI